MWGNHEHQRKKSKKGNNHSELFGTSVGKVCTVKIMSCKYECQFNLQLWYEYTTSLEGAERVYKKTKFSSDVTVHRKHQKV